MSIELQNFINPYISYHGKITPNEILLNSNLQEFANNVQILVNLNTGGKLGCEQVYEKIMLLSRQLLSNYEHLKESNEK